MFDTVFSYTFIQKAVNAAVVIVAISVFILLMFKARKLAEGLAVILVAVCAVMSILNMKPFIFGLAKYLFIFVRNGALPIVDGITDISFVFEYALDLTDRPHIPLFFGLTLKNVRKRAVTLIVEPCGCRDFFNNK
jgi:hypothetical protein